MSSSRGPQEIYLGDWGDCHPCCCPDSLEKVSCCIFQGWVFTSPDFYCFCSCMLFSSLKTDQYRKVRDEGETLSPAPAGLGNIAASSELRVGRPFLLRSAGTMQCVRSSTPPGNSLFSLFVLACVEINVTWTPFGFDEV